MKTKRFLGTNLRLPLYELKGNLIGKPVFSSTSGTDYGASDYHKLMFTGE